MSEAQALQFYADQIRDYMRDRADLNKLIEGEEHTDAMRKRAIEEALDNANSLPPLTEYSAEDFPYRTVLVDLATSRLLLSLALLMERNDLQVADAGGVAAKKTQVSALRPAANELRSMAMARLEGAKHARAVQEAVGLSGPIYSSYYGNNW